MRYPYDPPRKSENAEPSAYLRLTKEWKPEPKDRGSALGALALMAIFAWVMLLALRFAFRFITG